MYGEIILEIFGYLGTTMVLVSMMMTSLRRLRIVNISGSVISTIYSIITSAWPLVALNAGVIVINTYHLIRSARSGRRVRLASSSLRDGVFAYYLDENSEALSSLYPTLDISSLATAECYLAFDGGVAVGAIATVREGATVRILMLHATDRSGYIAILKAIEDGCEGAERIAVSRAIFDALSDMRLEGFDICRDDAVKYIASGV